MTKRQRTKRTPELDRSLVGITFIDVLFALVVGKILEPLTAWDRLSLVTYAHLIVALLLTVTSWIGYHNSWNRPRYFIYFVNLPLAQFAVDAALVIVYWLAAASAEGTYQFPGDIVVREPSARPEAYLVAASFTLYLIWDLIALRMRKDDDYKRFKAQHDVPRRRTVTLVCMVVAFTIAAFAACVNPISSPAILATDGALVLLLLFYRLAKERFGTREDRVGESVEAMLTDAVDVIDRAKRRIEAGERT